MGTTITKEQNSSAAKVAAENLSARFGDAGVTSEVVAHSAGKKFDFVRITCSPEQWRAVAKHLKNELGVNHCAMITGTHYPSGSADRGWEVAYHMHRWPITNVEAHTMIVHEGESLEGDDIPMEFEIFISLEAGDSPSVPSVQDLWVGADWNEKETWDLVGIDFEGHENMHRWPITNVEAHTMIVHEGESLEGDDIPMEFEIFISLEAGDSPSVPSVQDLWVGADWNEKETWDLVGIDFEGHENMHRVLNPHDSPAGFHPLQRQHKIRYHDFNEMYDDPQGFERKPVDEGRVK